MNIHNIRSKGFTLIELMVVLVIIAILASIAFPSYQRYVLRSHRVDARNMLQEAVQKLQQNYSISRDYSKLGDGTAINDTTLSNWGLSSSPSSGTQRYAISFRTGSLTATGFVLQAVPVGPQANEECGTFTINQANVKTARGLNSRHRDSVSCWTR